MKTITTIAFAIVVMTLASCQKENFEPMNTRPPFTSIDTAWNEHVVEGEMRLKNWNTTITAPTPEYLLAALSSSLTAHY